MERNPGCTYSWPQLPAQPSPIQGCCPSPPSSLWHHQLSTRLGLLYCIQMLLPSLTEKNKQNTRLNPASSDSFLALLISCSSSHPTLSPPRVPPSLLSPLQTGFCLLGFSWSSGKLTKISDRFCLLVLGHLAFLIFPSLWGCQGSQSLTIQSRLASVSHSSCLSLLSTGIAAGFPAHLDGSLLSHCDISCPPPLPPPPTTFLCPLCWLYFSVNFFSLSAHLLSLVSLAHLYPCSSSASKWKGLCNWFWPEL